MDINHQWIYNWPLPGPAPQYAPSSTPPPPTTLSSGHSPLSHEDQVKQIEAGLKAIEAARAGRPTKKGKPRMHLCPAEFIRAVVSVLEFGAVKHGLWDWEKGFPMMEAYDAMQRHLLAWQSGETNDPESGLPHTWHAACNQMFLVYFGIHRPDLDNRHAATKGPA